MTKVEELRVKEEELVAFLEENELVLGLDAPEILEKKIELAGVFKELGGYSDGIALLEVVVSVRERLLGKEDEQTLGVKTELADLYTKQGLYKNADTLLSEVLRVEGNSMRLLASYYLGILRREEGQYPDSEMLLDAVLKTREEQPINTGTPSILAIRAELADLYLSQAKYSETENLCNALLKENEDLEQDKLLEILDVKHILAKVYSSQGKYKEAETLYLEVLKAEERDLGTEHPSTLITKHNLARLYKEQGNNDEAERLFLEILEVEEQTLGSNALSTLRTKENLAKIYYYLDKDLKALEVFSEVFDARAIVFGLEHPDTQIVKEFMETIVREQEQLNALAALCNKREERAAPMDSMFQHFLSGKTNFRRN